jgi:hypothetical protein
MLSVIQKNWLARLLIAPVFFFNVQCAIAFLVTPQLYAASFELSGPPGEGMLRGLGLLFLMWNVPYAVALCNPTRQRASLYEAVAMQTIGVVGETLLLLTFSPGHAAMRASVGRFIIFDGSGLVLLVLAAWLVVKVKQ